MKLRNSNFKVRRACNFVLTAFFLPIIWHSKSKKVWGSRTILRSWIKYFCLFPRNFLLSCKILLIIVLNPFWVLSILITVALGFFRIFTFGRFWIKLRFLPAAYLNTFPHSLTLFSLAWRTFLGLDFIMCVLVWWFILRLGL